MLFRSVHDHGIGGRGVDLCDIGIRRYVGNATQLPDQLSRTKRDLHTQSERRSLTSIGTAGSRVEHVIETWKCT